MTACASNLASCTQPCDLELGLCKSYFSLASWLQVSSSNGRHLREAAWLEEKEGTCSFLCASREFPVPIDFTPLSHLSTLATPSCSRISKQFAIFSTLTAPAS